jgi:2-dehydro-3-deoxygalactonokinase
MIGVDWGTSSFRAYRIDSNGAVADQIETGLGILHVANGGFATTLRGAIAPWLTAGETRVLMSGMIGSRQGWVEAPYLPCPARAGDIAGHLVRVPFDDADVRIVPGLTATDAAGVPEVMRGEETQIIGADAVGLVCLPGSHAKWARVTQAGIAGFETFLSGEMFAALRSATILGRMMTGDGADDFDADAFDRGVARSGDPSHLLHHLFGVRSLALMGELTASASASYLSGLLIGHEVRAALTNASPAVQTNALTFNNEVTLLGATSLCTRYTKAISALGGTAATGPAHAAARGLARIGGLAAWE